MNRRREHFLAEASAARQCAIGMERRADEYDRDGDHIMAFAKRREAAWWERKADEYADLADYSDPAEDARFAEAAAILTGNRKADAA